MSERPAAAILSSIMSSNQQIPVSFADLSGDALETMATAGDEVLECTRVLTKVKANVVGEILKEQGTFYEWNHYPDGDVYDSETHAQYYYHAHRGAIGEHGHFHTFLRRAGMPAGVTTVAYEGDVEWPKDSEELTHFAAISMDKLGYPTHLFTTHRWVSGECWYDGGDVIAMLDRFNIDHAWPSWPTNRWITAMLRLFRPQIISLVRMRDRAVADWQAAHPALDVFEDRELEITSITPISVDDQIRAVEHALSRST